MAWSEAEPRGFLKNRLMALGMVAALTALLTLSLASTTVLDVLPRFRVRLWGGVSVYQTALWAVSSDVVPGLFTLLVFLVLYRWVPSAKVRWSHAFWGSLVAALLWEIATNAFVWYLGSGLVQYELVYGSLGAVVALLFWIYIGGLTTLFGAHVSAAIARRSR